MQLEEILSEWDKDTDIDYSELGEEARKIPRLHAKYLRLLEMEKMTLETLRVEVARFKFEKKQYYTTGPANMAEYEDKKAKWKTVPDKNRTVLRSEVDDHLDADTDVTDLHLRKELSAKKVDALEWIMKAIMARSFLINNMIDWAKWKGGQ